jgi:hypothetical protein
MKNILYLALFIAFVACSKQISPKKVNKRLTEGSWAITEFIDNEISILKKYQKVSLGFSNAGNISVISESGASGSWSVGNDKNPTILYLNFPEETDSLHVLTDDWVVYKFSKDFCVLKRNNKPGFNYETSIDQLTLTKK